GLAGADAPAPPLACPHDGDRLRAAVAAAAVRPRAHDDAGAQLLGKLDRDRVHARGGALPDRLADVRARLEAADAALLAARDARLQAARRRSRPGLPVRLGTRAAAGVDRPRPEGVHDAANEPGGARHAHARG